MRELVNFIRAYGQINLRTEELEAILRRCNHEGDQMISYQEFCELVSSNEDNLQSPEDLEEKNNQSNNKELRNDISNSPIRKSPSKTDIYEKSIDETLEQYSSPMKK